MLGICLGAQLIANILGAKVYPNTDKEIGWFDLQRTTEAESDSVFKSFPSSFTAFHWHGDMFDIPPDAKRMMGNTACKNQAFSYNNNVIGLQFHLESTPDSVSQLIENCADELTEGEYIQSPEELKGSPDKFKTINKLMEHTLSSLLEKTKAYSLANNAA